MSTGSKHPAQILLSSQAATQLVFKGVLPGANYTTNYPAFFNASSLAATGSIDGLQGEPQGTCHSVTSSVLGALCWQAHCGGNLHASTVLPDQWDFVQGLQSGICSHT